MKSLILATTALVLIGMTLPAAAGSNHPKWDRIEDRIDRLENRRDERVNHGPRDRIEDRLDRWEDRRDRNGKPVPKFMHRWERHSWKHRLHN